ncbi:MAG: hypothetical protein CM15mP103_04700 [Gammaproteobacteria bacterium]|nr:MAG: hypothetical protein CM15mP103_04700 [Gammaproteobacteria bacterium]
MPVGQQCQHQLMNQILLANNLLPQPVFEVREELVFTDQAFVTAVSEIASF